MTRVALVGLRHAGKTTVARMLAERGYVRLAFADVLKDLYVRMYNVFLAGIGYPPTFDRATLEAEKELHRLDLERWGTLHGRERDPLCWVRALGRRIDALGAERIVVDDVRFANEAEALRERGFLLVRVERDERARQKSIERALFNEACDRMGKDYIDMTDEEQSAVDRYIRQRLAETTHLPSEGEIDMVSCDVVLRNTSLSALRDWCDRFVMHAEDGAR